MIEILDVSKAYPNGVHALNHVKLKIDDGEFVSFKVSEAEVELVMSDGLKHDAMLAVCGRWRLVTRAMAVTKKVSTSIKASISLPTSKIKLRVHRNRMLTLKRAATSLQALLVCSAVWLGWLPVSA